MGHKDKEKIQRAWVKKLVTFIIVLVVALGGFCLLYFKTDVIKILLKETYDITFVVDGVEYVQKVEYGEIPVFRGDAIKQPTETEEYLFTHWSPTIVKATGNARYEAHFGAQERKYEIKLTSSISSACTITGGGKTYKYLDVAIINVETNKGYTFLGWYKGDDLYSTDRQITIYSVAEDMALVAKHEYEQRTISYVNEFEMPNPNPTSYTIIGGEITFKPLVKNGYNFTGWYTAQEGGEKVTEYNCSEFENITLYARWEECVYNITYNLNGGTNSPLNQNSYTVNSGDITVYAASKPFCDFVGWKGTGLSEFTQQFVIASGSTGHREYEAFFSGEKRTLSLNVSGKIIETSQFESGEVVTEPVISGSSYNMNGYEVSGWYSDSACQTPYTFTSNEWEDVTLYSKWEWQFNKGFIPYQQKFNTTSQFVIDSANELICYVDYVKFYDLGETPDFTLSYKSSSISNQELLDEIASAIKKSNCNGSSLTYSAGNGKGNIYVKNSIRSVEASLVIDESKDGVFVQQDYAFNHGEQNTRTSSYVPLVENAPYSLNVTTTNQLVYALEVGAKPVCENGSSAADIYAKAKEVLKKYVSDDMNDVEKLRAIYEWLVVNVEYDNVAAANNSIEWQKYDSWYAEGVFNNGKAVCDGIAKSFVILAKMENIPCLRIEGDMHAWNRVYINGAWYGVDATHGGVQFNSDSAEVLTYSQFMFTDAFKTSQGYTGTNYTEYAATTVYDYYDNYTLSTFDLLINSKQELVDVMKVVKNKLNQTTTKYLTVDVAVDSSLGVSISSLITYSNSLSGVQIKSYSKLECSTENDVYIFFIQK